MTEQSHDPQAGGLPLSTEEAADLGASPLPDLTAWGIADPREASPAFLAERLQETLADMVARLEQAILQAPDPETQLELSLLLQRTAELQADTTQALSDAGLLPSPEDV